MIFDGASFTPGSPTSSVSLWYCSSVYNRWVNSIFFLSVVMAGRYRIMTLLMAVPLSPTKALSSSVMGILLAEWEVVG
jgi:hypothetical protein